ATLNYPLSTFFDPTPSGPGRIWQPCTRPYLLTNPVKSPFRPIGRTFCRQPIAPRSLCVTFLGSGRGPQTSKGNKMKTPHKLARRAFLAATTSLVAVPTLPLARADEKPNPDEGVTAPEDLMKEHGVLNRCLLIYEEAMQRIRRR